MATALLHQGQGFVLLLLLKLQLLHCLHPLNVNSLISAVHRPKHSWCLCLRQPWQNHKLKSVNDRLCGLGAEATRGVVHSLVRLKEPLMVRFRLQQHR
jgi:hypothetical protein